MAPEEPYFIARLEGWGSPTLAIGRSLHSNLGFFQRRLEQNLCIVNHLDVRIRRRGWGLWGGREEGELGIETVVGEERCQGCGRMQGIVVGKFCYGQQTRSIRLLVIGVDA